MAYRTAEIGTRFSNALKYADNNCLQRGREGMKKRNYSAKAAAAGKDIGKPGKNFSKIAASAGKRYGSAAAGKRVAGAILARLRGGVMG